MTNDVFWKDALSRITVEKAAEKTSEQASERATEKAGNTVASDKTAKSELAKELSFAELFGPLDVVYGASKSSGKKSAKSAKSAQSIGKRAGRTAGHAVPTTGCAPESATPSVSTSAAETALETPASVSLKIPGAKTTVDPTTPARTDSQTESQADSRRDSQSASRHDTPSARPTDARPLEEAAGEVAPSNAVKGSKAVKTKEILPPSKKTEEESELGALGLALRAAGKALESALAGESTSSDSSASEETSEERFADLLSARPASARPVQPVSSRKSSIGKPLTPSAKPTEEALLSFAELFGAVDTLMKTGGQSVRPVETQDKGAEPQDAPAEVGSDVAAESTQEFTPDANSEAPLPEASSDAATRTAAEVVGPAAGEAEAATAPDVSEVEKESEVPVPKEEETSSEDAGIGVREERVEADDVRFPAFSTEPSGESAEEPTAQEEEPVLPAFDTIVSHGRAVEPARTAPAKKTTVHNASAPKGWTRARAAPGTDPRLVLEMTDADDSDGEEPEFSSFAAYETTSLRLYGDPVSALDPKAELRVRVRDDDRSAKALGPRPVFADRAYRLSFDADELVRAYGTDEAVAAWEALPVHADGRKRFIANLYLDGELITAYQRNDPDGRTTLCTDANGHDGRIFVDWIGFVSLELTLQFGEVSLTLTAEPVSVCLPEGPSARRIEEMADCVMAHYGEWLAPQGTKSVVRVEKGGTNEKSPADGARPFEEAEREERSTPCDFDASREDDETVDTMDTDTPDLRSAEAAVVRDRLEAVDRLLRIYETSLPYFRANPRMKLVTEHTVDNVEKLRDFSYATARFMAMHPETLMPAYVGRGIRVGKRVLRPQKTLVQSERKSADTEENRVVVGFLKTLSDEMSEERDRVRARLEELRRSDEEERRRSAGEPGTADAGGAYGANFSAYSLRSTSDKPSSPSSGEPSGVSVVLPQGYRATDRAVLRESEGRLVEILEALEERIRHVRALWRHYSEAMPVTPVPITGLIPPTQVFLTVPVYRTVYEAIRDWLRSEWVLRDEEACLASFFRRSRLYECFSLVTLLEAFRASGLEPVRRSRFVYTPPYRGWEQSDYANTFVFEKREASQSDPGRSVVTAEVTLYYEPVIRAASADYDRRNAPLCENGVRLCRTTVFSPEETADGSRLRTLARGASLCFTPDFLVRVRAVDEKGVPGRATWFVADAKYATAETVTTYRAMPTAFKYLLGMRPLSPADRIGGLWLFCGKRSGGSAGSRGDRRSGPYGAQGSIQGMGAMAGLAVGADLFIETMVPAFDGTETEEKLGLGVHAAAARFAAAVLRQFA